MELELKDLQNLQTWELRKRLRLVSDLIFMSAMTILVLTLEVPGYEAGWVIKSTNSIIIE